MNANKIRRGVLFVVFAGALALGCELIVDFDRTKIPGEPVIDAAVVADASSDGAPDKRDLDASPDAADATDSARLGDASDAATDAPDGD